MWRSAATPAMPITKPNSTYSCCCWAAPARYRGFEGAKGFLWHWLRGLQARVCAGEGKGRQGLGEQQPQGTGLHAPFTHPFLARNNRSSSTACVNSAVASAPSVLGCSSHYAVSGSSTVMQRRNNCKEPVPSPSGLAECQCTLIGSWLAHPLRGAAATPSVSPRQRGSGFPLNAHQ